MAYFQISNDYSLNNKAKINYSAGIRTNYWDFNNETFITSKHLILSSSLLAHPRCVTILKTNSLPLRDALIPGKDQVVDSLLKETKKLTYLLFSIVI